MNSSIQFFGQEHSNNLDQRQAVSLRDVNNEESTTYPTHYQPLLQRPNWNPKTNKQSTGWTGKPKGRPPGARNKPKGPDHDLPKVPKKRGRPLGAKNKYPRGTWGAYPSMADRKGSPNESGSSQTPASNMAGNTLVMSPAAPTEDSATYPNPSHGYRPHEHVLPGYVPYGYAPHGYEQATLFSASLDSTTPIATSSSSTSTYQDDFLPPVATPSPFTPTYLNDFTTPSPFTSTYQNDFTTPTAAPYYTSTTSTYANQGDHGYQYPPPSNWDGAFGNGYFTYDNNGNNRSSSSSNEPFASSIPYQEGTLALDAPTPFLPGSATPQAYDASTSSTEANDGLSKLRPRSSIIPNLVTEAQDQPPAPATQELFDINDYLNLDLGSDNFFMQVEALEQGADAMGDHPTGELNNFD